MCSFALFFVCCLFFFFFWSLSRLSSGLAATRQQLHKDQRRLPWAFETIQFLGWRKHVKTNCTCFGVFQQSWNVCRKHLLLIKPNLEEYKAWRNWERQCHLITCLLDKLSGQRRILFMNISGESCLFQDKHRRTGIKSLPIMIDLY